MRRRVPDFRGHEKNMQSTLVPRSGCDLCFASNVPPSLQTRVQRAVVALVAMVLAVRVGVAAQAVTQPALRAAFLRTAAILDELCGAPVLTVSDGAELIRSGGSIGLIVEEGRMRFAINPDAAHRAGLRLSSRLLQLAKISTDDRHDRA